MEIYVIWEEPSWYRYHIYSCRQNKCKCLATRTVYIEKWTFRGTKKSSILTCRSKWREKWDLWLNLQRKLLLNNTHCLVFIDLKKKQHILIGGAYFELCIGSNVWQSISGNFRNLWKNMCVSRHTRLTFSKRTVQLLLSWGNFCSYGRDGVTPN